MAADAASIIHNFPTCVNSACLCHVTTSVAQENRMLVAHADAIPPNDANHCMMAKACDTNASVIHVAFERAVHISALHCVLTVLDEFPSHDHRCMRQPIVQPPLYPPCTSEFTRSHRSKPMVAQGLTSTPFQLQHSSASERAHLGFS